MQRQMFNRRDNVLTEETQHLIDSAVARGLVQQCQPAAAAGAHLNRIDRKLLSQKRREFRKANK